MNVQFPREEQKLFSDGDGAGASVVFYFKITPTTLAQLQVAVVTLSLLLYSLPASVLSGCVIVQTCSGILSFTRWRQQGPMAERSPALQLLTEWCRVAPDDPNFRGRFKCMGFIDRIQVFGT
jgi:hypothetical protein